MAIIPDIHDIDSTTTESLPGEGVATPNTESEALRDRSGIHAWLCSSNTHNEIEYFGSLEVTRTSDPSAGNTFLIIDKSQSRALACHGGHLRLEDANNLGSDELIPQRWQWYCTEKDGFKGFQNIAERGFLGHDIWWDFYAKVPCHDGWESFAMTRHEGGYYWIQTLYWWTLWQVSARSDGHGVFAQRDGGSLWEFIKVHEVEDSHLLNWP